MVEAENPEYVIDVSAIVDLYGFNPSTALTPDPVERERALANLTEMIRRDQVVTVYASRKEIERRARPW